MKTIANFHHRDTEGTENRKFLVCREVPANQKTSLWPQYLRGTIIVLALIVSLAACANKKETIKKTDQIAVANFPIVVYPVENLSGVKAPIQEIRKLFIEKLKQAGFEVLGEEALERFMVRNRIRYTGGLDGLTAKAFKEQIGVQGVVIISVELWNEDLPPKVALISRLVSTGDQATIQWIDGIGMAGDDSPGLLSLGLVEDPRVLMNRAVRSLVESLVGWKDSKHLWRAKKRYQPKIAFRSPLLEIDKKLTVAVVPFFDISERKYAGEIMVLHFVKQLTEFENFEVLEPGLVRQELLNLRIIMEDSISLAQTDVLFGILNVDLIAAGKVMDYQDYKSAWGKAKVDFSSQLIERQSRQVVWSSRSYNDGEEAVYFFDWGKVNTAHVLTNRMVRSIGEMVVRGVPEEVPREEEEPVQPMIGY
jgi:TolB-like protein